MQENSEYQKEEPVSVMKDILKLSTRMEPDNANHARQNVKLALRVLLNA